MQSQNPVPDNLDSVVIKLNKTHLTILNDLDTALTTALATLKKDDTENERKYVIFKDLQNEDKGWYLVYDLITHAINNEEMDDKYFTKRASGKSITLHMLSKGIFTFIIVSSIELNGKQVQNLTLYGKSLKLGLESVKKAENGDESVQYEIRPEDVKIKIAQRSIVAAVLGALVILSLLAIALGGFIVPGDAASTVTPLNFFLTLFLICLLSKVQ